jgi:hypothetical protein
MTAIFPVALQVLETLGAIFLMAAKLIAIWM